jgi:predicted metal-binding membrane protein
MAGSNDYSTTRPQTLTVALLLVLAAAAWLILVWQSRMAGGAMGLTMGMRAPFFLAIWVVMMIAMMLPSAGPMVQMLQRIAAAKRAQRQAFVPAWVFVAGYLAVWTLFGALAYLVASAIDGGVSGSARLMGNGPRFGGLVLVIAGLYQLTPLKRVCLSKCRSPLSFLLTSWHDGYNGAFRMGVEHGSFCLGCCWAMMLILFVVGVMSIPWMALLSAAIFLEKNVRFERLTTAALATLFIAGGLSLAAYPSVLQHISS